MIFFDSIHFCHSGRGFVALLRSSMDLFCDNHVANARFPTAIPIQRDSVSIAKVGEELEKKHAGAHHSSQIENLSLSFQALVWILDDLGRIDLDRISSRFFAIWNNCVCVKRVKQPSFKIKDWLCQKTSWKTTSMACAIHLTAMSPPHHLTCQSVWQSSVSKCGQTSVYFFFVIEITLFVCVFYQRACQSICEHTCQLTRRNLRQYNMWICRSAYSV